VIERCDLCRCVGCTLYDLSESYSATYQDASVALGVRTHLVYTAVAVGRRSRRLALSVVQLHGLQACTLQLPCQPTRVTDVCVRLALSRLHSLHLTSTTCSLVAVREDVLVARLKEKTLFIN